MRSKTIAAVLCCGVACGLASRVFGPPREPINVETSVSERLRKANDRRAQEHTGQVVAGVVAVTFALGYVVVRRASDMNLDV